MVASVRMTAFTFRTGNGTQDVTIPGAGTCKGYIVFLSNGQVSGTEVRSASLSFGMVGTSGAEHHQTYTSLDAQATSLVSTHESPDFLRSKGPNGGGSIFANHDSFITDGFRFNITGNNNREELAKAIVFYGDDINCIVGEITTSTTDDAEVTDSVAQQTDLLFLIGRNIASASSVVPGADSFGVAAKVGASIRQGGFSFEAESGVGTSNVRSAVSSSRIALQLDLGGTDANAAWEVTTMSATEIGITTRIDSGAAVGSTMGYMSVNFNGAVEFDVGTLTLPTSTGNNGHTGVGFPPQFILQAMTNATSYLVEGGAHIAHQANYIGLADATTEGCVGSREEDGLGTTDGGSLAETDIVATLDESGSAEHAGTFVSFDSDGWTVNYTLAPVAYVGFWLAVGDPTPPPPPVTGFSSSSSGLNFESATSDATPVAGSVALTAPVNPSLSHCFVSIQQFDVSGNPVVAGAGTYAISIKTINSEVWEDVSGSPIDGTAPETQTFDANVSAIRVIPTAITVAVTYKLFLSANRK